MSTSLFVNTDTETRDTNTNIIAKTPISSQVDSNQRRATCVTHDVIGEGRTIQAALSIRPPGQWWISGNYSFITPMFENISQLSPTVIAVFNRGWKSIIDTSFIWSLLFIITVTRMASRHSFLMRLEVWTAINGHAVHFDAVSKWTAPLFILIRCQSERPRRSYWYYLR